MRSADILRLSLINALRGRIRTVLTAAATAIGVAATILVVAIGSTARQAVSAQLDSIGISGSAIYPRKTATNMGISLSTDDAAEVMGRVDGINSAMSLVVKYGTYRIKNWQGNALIYGVDEQLNGMINLEVLYGRLPTASDVRQGRAVAVVDDQLANMVYSRSNIVGKNIILTVDGFDRDFEIIGIISSQSSGVSAVVGDVLPSFMYVPNSAAGIGAVNSEVEQLLVSGDDTAAVSRAVDYLNRKYNTSNGFKYEDIGGYRSQIDGAMVTVSMFIAAVGGISMVVAGIGIMNSMLSTAIERRREVGIYMSLGARRKDIMLGFLAESAIISAAGGLGGVTFGLVAIAAIGKFSGFVITIDLSTVAVVEITAVLCGVLFGVLPAVRASRLDPIEALRD